MCLKSYRKGRFEENVKFQLLSNMSRHSFCIYKMNIVCVCCVCVYRYMHTNREDFSFLSLFYSSACGQISQPGNPSPELHTVLLTLLTPMFTCLVCWDKASRTWPGHHPESEQCSSHRSLSCWPLKSCAASNKSWKELKPITIFINTFIVSYYLSKILSLGNGKRSVLLAAILGSSGSFWKDTWVPSLEVE